MQFIQGEVLKFLTNPCNLDAQQRGLEEQLIFGYEELYYLYHENPEINVRCYRMEYEHKWLTECCVDGFGVVVCDGRRRARTWTGGLVGGQGEGQDLVCLKASWRARTPGWARSSSKQHRWRNTARHVGSIGAFSGDVNTVEKCRRWHLDGDQRGRARWPQTDLCICA